jgi:DNA-binding beta-propeller fold protein YncE
VTAEGAPGGSAVAPRSFKVDRDDNIYVLDIFSARVLLLNPDGKYRTEIAFPKDYGFFSDLAVDPKGTVLLIDSVRAVVLSAAKNTNAFSPLGGLLKEYLAFPVSLTTDSRGTIYITDANGADIGIMAHDGAFLGKQLGMGWSEGLLYYPSQMCIYENGEVFIADRGNSRVQEFTPVK